MGETADSIEGTVLDVDSPAVPGASKLPEPPRVHATVVGFAPDEFSQLESSDVLLTSLCRLASGGLPR